MRHDNISISLPSGYKQSLDEESRRHGLNRSELIRILFDAYLRAAAGQIALGKRETNEFFYDVLPHKRAEATKWLHDYLRIVLMIVKERSDQKKETGTVDQDGVW